MNIKNMMYIYYNMSNPNLYTNIFYKIYSKNIYSQNGEDGIIEELLKRLNITKGWVCEFGAWDGILLSNTFNLVKNGFDAVFIEGDVNKYNDLLHLFSLKTPIFLNVYLSLCKNKVINE
jgi:hypothetical protein